MANLVFFFRDALTTVTSGNRIYHVWMAFLTLLMLAGGYAYWIQLDQGLGVTGMHDHVSWGLYISNFTFLVGMAAAAVMLVMPTYVLKESEFTRAVLVGEGVAVAALVMCMMFVTVDLGGPQNLWHVIPGLGSPNFPASLLTWDIVVLNGYLVLNLVIPFYLLYSRYTGKKPNRRFYLPLIYLSVLWAVAIHMVTAFLLAGLPARPFWNSSLMGPRFLASAFAGGPAFMILALGVVNAMTPYHIKRGAFHKLAMIIAVAAQINLIMLVSEIFKEFYWPTQHGLSARYLFFGLHGKSALVPWIWTSIALNVMATVVLTIHPLRRSRVFLFPACFLLFIAIWMEKGMGLVIPGFVPSPLGEVAEYFPTWVELAVTVGIWGMGLFVFTVLVRVAIPIELGSLRSPPPAPAADTAPPASRGATAPGG